MKRAQIQRMNALALLLLGNITVASANVPPPPVNQKMGIPDAVFNNLTESNCRGCHGGASGAGNAGGVIAGRHHLKVGQIIPPITASPYGSPGGTYNCDSCHQFVWNPAINALDMVPFHDCLLCHKQIAGEASVHHLTFKAQSRDCKACHGPIDNPNDGHYIPTYQESLVTPAPGLGTGALGIGGCAFCHQAGVDSVSGTQVYNNAATHHRTGVVLGPFTQPKTAAAGCDLCHAINADSATAPSIRGCEACHGVNSLHNIQVDSNNNGIYPDQETAYFGHIGAQDDCMGCHGSMMQSASAAYSGPVVPNLAALSANSFRAGKNFTLTLSGSGFTNYLVAPTGTLQYSSNLLLIDQNDRQQTLPPASITESRMQVTLPASLAAGNYIVKAEKSFQASNAMSVSILPEVIINSFTCSDGAFTINGSGFSQYFDANGSGTSVSVSSCSRFDICKVSSWTDTKIEANCSFCGPEIQVFSVFGTASIKTSGAGDLSSCTKCHADYGAKVSCTNKVWLQHARKFWITCATNELAEKTYLGYSCSERNSAASAIIKNSARKR